MVPFSRYVDEWLTTYQGRTTKGIRSLTLEEYGVDLRRAVRFFGKTPISHIDPVMVEEFANVRLRDEGLSSGTRRRILRPLKVLFATAVQRGHIKSNPAASLRITGKDVPKPEGYRKYLEREEVQRIIAGTPEGWKRTFIRTAALTGLRRCELFGLQWDDIDFDAGVLHVRRSVRKGKVDDTKTESSAREFPLGRSLAADLRKHKMASKFSKGTDFVFPTSTGRARTRLGQRRPCPPRSRAAVAACAACRWRRRALRRVATPITSSAS